MDVDLDRSLYSTFVTAANSISQLYTQASQQQKRAHVEGSRQALEKLVNWIVREQGTPQAIPTHFLLDYLRFELQNLDSAEQQCVAGPPGLAFFQQNQNPNINPGAPSPAKRIDLSASSFVFGGAADEARGMPQAQQQQQAFAHGGVDTQMAQQQLHMQQQQFGSYGHNMNEAAGHPGYSAAGSGRQH